MYRRQCVHLGGSCSESQWGPPLVPPVCSTLVDTQGRLGACLGQWSGISCCAADEARAKAGVCPSHTMDSECTTRYAASPYPPPLLHSNPHQVY